jgi:hypothetical protein
VLASPSELAQNTNRVRPPQPERPALPDLTSTQRLAFYRDELRDAGFSDDQVANLIGIAAPRIDDLEVKADVEDGSTPIGEVRVRLRPHLDGEELRRVVEGAKAVAEGSLR